MPFANNKIRISYYIPLKEGEAVSEFRNTNPEEAAKFGGELNQTEEEALLVHFNRRNNYRQVLVSELGEELKGLKSYNYLFHTKDINNFTKFNNWNFSSSLHWDSEDHPSFWYDQNTTILFMTENYKVGEEQIKSFNLNLLPEKIVKIDHLVKTQVLGIPVDFENDEHREVLWKEATDINEDYLIDLRPEFKSSKTSVQLSFDFTERIIRLNYYTVFDMLSKIGGFKAAIGPIVAFIAPFFILYFLVKLSKILKGKMLDSYQKEVRAFVALSK